MSTIISNKKLICFSAKYYLFSEGPKLYISAGTTENESYLGTLPVGGAKSLLGSVRLFARALRLEPRCGIFVSEDVAIISYHGCIYRVDCKAKTIELEHRFRPEMNNPLCFTRIEGLDGLKDGIYYGEYFLNHEGAPVHIHRRNSDGTWQVVYTFPEGSIYHIHGLIPCKDRESVFILTGDKNVESGIFEAVNNFDDVKVIASGKQAYRACVALPIENGLLYTTDTPLEQNYLYKIDFDKKKPEIVAEIDGPCIYGKIISKDEMVFSTSVEPDSRITGLKYEFTYKLGEGVKNKNTHLYHVKWDGKKAHMQEIFSAEKDIIPMGAGQFGTLMFPEGNGQLYVTGQAVRKYDNKTLLIDKL